MADTKYCYAPDFKVLKNKLGIKNQKGLDEYERHMVTDRQRQGVPQGNFDLRHLQKIHRHLFQDVYSWAGKLREVEISKGRSQFQPSAYIETGMADIHSRLKRNNFLKNLNKKDFSKEAGKILGDVNHVHPFREGNGRTQMQYLRQLAHNAGHRIDVSCLQKQEWLEASKQAHRGNYEPMGAAIEDAIVSKREKKRAAEVKSKKHFPKEQVLDHTEKVPEQDLSRMPKAGHQQIDSSKAEKIQKEQGKPKREIKASDLLSSSNISREEALKKAKERKRALEQDFNRNH